MSSRLGEPLPAGDEHAVSVSLPQWADTEGWASRDPRVLSQLRTGYPRFYVPHFVRDLAARLVERAAASGLVAAGHEAAMLFPSEPLAKACRSYLETRGGPGTVTVVHASFDGRFRVLGDSSAPPPRARPDQDVYAAVYPERLAAEAKAFWQHTGFGVSSRFAAFWAAHAPFLSDGPAATPPMPYDGAPSLVLRRRLAGLYSDEAAEVGVDDVFLYPSGMSALAHTALALRRLRGAAGGEAYRVAVFGFPYVDTFRVLSEVHGFDCVLYGHSSPAGLDALEADLAGELRIDALYTEFPGNPLLGSVDMPRLRGLSRRHGFVVVVDDTVGTPVNVRLLAFADVVCASLTKMFSGACNVMGGSAVVGCRAPELRGRLRAALGAGAGGRGHSDTYFPADAAVMVRNSADFGARVAAAGRNAERVADVLRRHRAVDSVFYPRGSPTQPLYDRVRRPGAGYGYLLSVRFVAPAAAVAFHDALDVAKGPSLGTNFTLCCAYTLLAHSSELDWVGRFGLFEHLVRISVGVESWDHLGGVFERALAAAEEHVGPE